MRMGFILMCMVFLFPIQASTLQDVLGWEVRRTWNDFAASAEAWREQWTPYTIGINNKALVKDVDKKFHAWEAIMKQIGDL